jgi:hypothetical protein
VRSYFEKNTSQERAGGVAQGVGPEFKTQHWKKKRISVGEDERVLEPHGGDGCTTM